MARFSERIARGLGVVATLLACSPPTIGNTNPSVACADYALSNCNRIQACSPTVLAERYPNIQTCYELLNATCFASLPSGNETWPTGDTPSWHEACSVAISSWACVDFLAILNAPAACNLTKGPGPAGSSCAFGSQCQTGVCNIAQGDECGQCGAPPNPGDSCTNLVSCGRGVSCFQGTCRTEVNVVGAICGATSVCINGFSCIMGMCQQGVGSLNAPCVPTPSGPGCDFRAGLVCDAQSQTCLPAQLAGYGQPCGTLSGQPVQCAGGSTCANGVCLPVGSIGADCDWVNGPGCISPSHCVAGSGGGTSGTCQVPSGSACHP